MMSTIRGAKKRRTHELLLTTARDLFETRGYAATTIDDIASGAGTTRATLYLHFSSKAELLQILVEGVDELFSASEQHPLEEVVESGHAAGIRAWLERQLDRWTEIRPYLAVVNQSDVDPAISSIVGRWHDNTVGRMRAGLDAADRFDLESRTIRCTIAFGALETLSRRFIHRGGWGELDRDSALDALALAWTHLLAAPTR
jgi:AcrR family transcriptional regulator